MRPLAISSLKRFGTDWEVACELGLCTLIDKRDDGECQDDDGELLNSSHQTGVCNLQGFSTKLYPFRFKLKRQDLNNLTQVLENWNLNIKFRADI